MDLCGIFSLPDDIQKSLASYHVPGNLKLFIKIRSLAVTHQTTEPSPLWGKKLSPRLAFPTGRVGSNLHGMTDRTPGRSSQQNHLPNCHLKCHYEHFISLSWTSTSPWCLAKITEYMPPDICITLFFSSPSLLRCQWYLAWWPYLQFNSTTSCPIIVFFSVALTIISHVYLIFIFIYFLIHLLLWLECKFHEGRNISVLFVPVFPELEQCLAHSKCSRSIYWIN